jgi:hypothetical protein
MAVMTSTVLATDCFNLADLGLLRSVLAKLDRWYTPATAASTPAPRSVTIQASGPNGSGAGAILSASSLSRVGLLIFSPSAATALYISTQQNFGQANQAASSMQYGMFLAAGTYLSFGQEYAGPMYAYNAAVVGSAALDVRVLELFADPAAL